MKFLLDVFQFTRPEGESWINNVANSDRLDFLVDEMQAALNQLEDRVRGGEVITRDEFKMELITSLDKFGPFTEVEILLITYNIGSFEGQQERFEEAWQIGYNQGIQEGSISVLGRQN